MATRREPILNWAMKPSGAAYVTAFENIASNDRWPHLVLVFEDGSDEGHIFGTFGVPQNYVDSASVVVVWTTASTSGTTHWEMEYRAVGGNDTESLDQTSHDQSALTTDDAPSAAFERLEASIALTDGNFAAGDTVQFQFGRNPTYVLDDLADIAILFGLYFEYDDGT